MLSACVSSSISKRTQSTDFTDVQRVEYAPAPVAAPSASQARRASQATVAHAAPSSSPFACCTTSKACKLQRGISYDGTIQLDPSVPTQYPPTGQPVAVALPPPGARSNATQLDAATGAYTLLDDDSDGEDEVAKFVKSLSDMNSDIRGLRNSVTVLVTLISVLSAALLWVAYGELAPGAQAQARRWGLLASIPIVACLFTWFHIWLAIRMMFLPLKFLGLWQYGNTGLGVGWQGVVPRKAHKMAKTSYSQARPYLDGPRDWLQRVDPQMLVAKIRPQLKQIIEEALVRAGTKHFQKTGQRALFDGTRKTLSEAAVATIHETCGDLWAQYVDLLSDPEHGIDNDGLIVKVFTENKETLNKFFLTLGAHEFKFIEHCGAALGFFCGVVQLIAFNHLDDLGRTIFLPSTGFFLGIVTNWLAILMVFKPCFPRPVKLFGWHVYDIQGLFLKRQPEVCVLYSKMLCEHFLAFDKIVEYLGTLENLWAKLKDRYVAFSASVMKQTLGSTGSWLAAGALGQAKFAEFEEDLKRELVLGLKEAHCLHRISGRYIGKVTDIENCNCRALQRMPPDQFENLLHPVFQEDEWILILLGGVLGAIVGIAQVYFLSK